MKEKNLTVIEHIDEIRKRLMVIVVFFVIAVIGSFFIAKPIIKFLQLKAGYEEFHAFNVVDPIALYLKVIIFLAVVIISPVIMYQFWSFISPGLHETERKVTLSYIPFAFLLLLVGIMFSYFVLVPFVMNFMKELSAELGITQTVGINEYFTFLFQILIPFGVIFQLPIVLLFLSRLGILDPAKLVKIRKVAYFVLFVIAAFITPPDLMSHLLVTVPLFALYEISIVICRVGYRKFLKAEEKRKIEEIKAEQQRQIDEVMGNLEK
ncbi:twin-arginine translocase subunit TatC [Sporosarcina sp. Marseille-Q4943]|uniref:twin-arginine translocase subunit TatC n=1 Tax=Sporosarcina sp. Marseille-Q4943 TaxID=2942204 RepID=UPI00208DCD56|nr:twin-arginine translocase subunit TatC [Sporosarcina sp. Marseille-Q4943]